MRLVLDTNVVVSAFINPNGKPSVIIKLVLQRKADLIINSTILNEYENVALRPKFSQKIDPEIIRQFIKLLKNISISFDPLPGKIKLLDESDRIFYDTAKKSGAILITGNIKHFPKENFIMQPAEFLSQLG